PRLKVFVTDRPVNGNAVTEICFEIKIAQPVTLTAPHNRPTPNVVATHPVEAVDFCVGIFKIVYKPVLGGLGYSVSCSCLLMLLFKLFLCRSSGVWDIPWILRRRWVIGMLYHPATLQH